MASFPDSHDPRSLVDSMYQVNSIHHLTILISLLAFPCLVTAQTETTFDLSGYDDQSGFRVYQSDQVLDIRWNGGDQDDLAMQFSIAEGAPVIRRWSIRSGKGDEQIVAMNVRPQLRIVSGVRRITQQQTEPLEEMGRAITNDVIDRHKWDAFWDAPLVTGDRSINTRKSSIPAAKSFANHPGMPRKESEVLRAPTRWHCDRCIVESNGARLSIRFPGVEAGLFSGYLQFDLFRGCNLVRQMAVMETEHPSVAMKYDAGLTAMPINPASRIVYRDLANQWQDYRFGSPIHQQDVIVHAANRTLAFESDSGSLAVLPPPHSFYWARETARNLGYGYYRKLTTDTCSFGIRQAEAEIEPEFEQNFALYNARPGRPQYLPVFYVISAGDGTSAIDSAMRFTNADRFRSLPGYKVMGHHYHVGLVQRLESTGGFARRINDVEAVKAAGIDIYSIVDGVRGSARHDRGIEFVHALADYYQAARMQSDSDFLLAPNDENSTGGRPPFLGGHYDLIFSHPVFWRPRRDPDETLYELHERYGRIYHIGSAADLMEMCELENILVSMPHPNAKRSTGYPEAILDEPHFLNERYFSLGYRWGMGIDASERRLGEYRFQTLWDQTNNRLVELGRKPKFALAISEVRSDHTQRGKPPWDDVYGVSPVNHVRLEQIPPVDQMGPLVDSLRQGNYFVTSGEVLIPSCSVTRDGDTIQVRAEVQWTFPLDFVEVVWGDGETVRRKVVKATDLPAFSHHEFKIQLDADHIRWVRFAAWDCATNGAMTQPVSVSR